MSSPSLIPHTQQFGDDLWHLGRGEAVRLPVGRQDRILSVVEGRLWITIEGREDELPEDIWLEPGETVQLRHVRSLVAEASPCASFRVSVPPAPAAAGHGFGAWIGSFGGRAV